MACISSNVAITSAAEKIMCGDADIVVCGGCETFSDVPIRFSRPIRQRFLGAAKVDNEITPSHKTVLFHSDVIFDFHIERAVNNCTC